MPKHYPANLRRTVCERMLEGEGVRVLAKEYSIGSGTLHRWRRQALIDAGRSVGVASYQSDPLGDARRRINAATRIALLAQILA